RVEIPKDKGKVRQLGIPTTTDRVIQQAIYQVLSPIYERKFSDSSFGFRPNKSPHDALRKIREIAEEGYEWVVDIDLETFF
ncbi:MAG: maturase, partial [Tissierellia bacterium]|nr:maturase [Tissierellia bacterium]